jgi:hypothetical protein
MQQHFMDSSGADVRHLPKFEPSQVSEISLQRAYIKQKAGNFLPAFSDAFRRTFWLRILLPFGRLFSAASFHHFIFS